MFYSQKKNKCYKIAYALIGESIFVISDIAYMESQIIVLLFCDVLRVEFPAGILQGTFFSNDRPRYMNYGAIGLVIGHEITHGFDDQGRQFNKKGNLVDWWEPETKEQYLKRAECIIYQYGNYTVEDVGMNVRQILRVYLFIYFVLPITHNEFYYRKILLIFLYF